MFYKTIVSAPMSLWKGRSINMERQMQNMKIQKYSKSNSASEQTVIREIGKGKKY